MCFNPFYKTNPDPEYVIRKELVESISRLNDWIFDEIAFYHDDPELSKKIVRIRNKLPINM